jgi:hypothetical protein
MRLPLLIPLLAAQFIAAAAATAADFTLLIYETPAQLALRTDPGPKGAAYWQGFADAGAALAKSGALRGGAALAAPAARIGNGSGNGSAIVPTGYFIISAADLAAAKALAGAIPAAKSGHVEIVPHAPAKTGM